MEINSTLSHLNNEILIKRLSNAIRFLSIDAVEKASSGHPGMPMGMSDVMTVLGLHFLKFNPQDPKWFARDRLVLSAGHGSMLLYAFFYLTGYKDFSLEEIKNFRALNSKAAGHPESTLYEGIETTTGPLGQGIATAVGMAIAQKKHEEKLGANLAASKVFCIVGDGCLMEGISYEAFSLAGHLNLDNLIVLFDDNSITIDGPTSLAVSENHIEKFKALNFECEKIDGHNFQEIHDALDRASKSNKPFFIACKTIIGFGSPLKQDTEHAHGSPLGEDEVKATRLKLDWKSKPFEIDDELLKIWRATWLRNKNTYEAWQQDFLKLSSELKEYIKGTDIHRYLEGLNLKALLPTGATISEATRSSSGRVIEYLLNNEKIIAGSADLSLSNCVKPKSVNIISKDCFKGNYLHFGAREALMGAILNGLYLSGFHVLGGTFLVFTDYMRPAIRLAAIMKLKIIYIMTHDSIGVGEDGPTHQPIEHLSSFRAMPNINVMRPADIIETFECFEVALKQESTPSILALTRQKLNQIRVNNWEENLSKFGAYVIRDYENVSGREICIFATGSEVELGLQTANILARDFKVRVVSVPCVEIFFEQEQNYIDSILNIAAFNVVIEAASSFGWHRFTGPQGMMFCIDQFGISAPHKDILKEFGIEAEEISEKVRNKLISL